MSLKSFIKRNIAPFATAIFKANDIRLDKGFSIPANVKMKGARLSGKISLSEGCQIRDDVRISAASRVTIGRYTSINGPATMIRAAINPVRIGNFCSVARQVTIQEFNHRTDGLSSYHVFKNIFNEGVEKDIESKGGIVIGNDVWVGANASLLSGVNIGHGAVIAANSVVSKDVPDYAIVAGVPAKVIKMRFDQSVIDRLLEIEWWEWSTEKIKRNRTLFEESISLEKLDEIN